jgi:hypothetical protein
VNEGEAYLDNSVYTHKGREHPGGYTDMCVRMCVYGVMYGDHIFFFYV